VKRPRPTIALMEASIIAHVDPLGEIRLQSLEKILREHGSMRMTLYLHGPGIHGRDAVRAAAYTILLPRERAKGLIEALREAQLEGVEIDLEIEGELIEINRFKLRIEG